MKSAAEKSGVKIIRDAPKKKGYILRGDNRVALSCKEHEFILSGPADTGKTMACCIKVHLICRLIPGAQGAIVRETKTSLRSSVLNTFERVIKNQGVKTLGGENPSRYIYPNGSTIWLGGMDKPDKVLSSERDFIYVNQAEELSLNSWEILGSRCSGRGAVIAIPQLFGDCNPGGSKHWIRERAKQGRLRLLVTTHKDNPTLYNEDGTMIDSQEVRRRMLVLDNMTGVRKLRLKEGIWATAEGAVYEMFNAERTGQKSDHVQVRSREEMQRFYFALDDGFTNPAVILDIGSDSDGRWHIFQEFYKRGWIQDDVADIAKGWHIKRPVELAAVDEAAAGLIEALKRKGVPARAGKGKIFDGIAKIQAKLKVQADGRPRLTVDPSCVETINEFESYIWKPEKDVPVDEWNHSMGALRYLSDALNEPTGAFESASDILTGQTGDIETPEQIQTDEVDFSDMEIQ